jgi:hypothetical protein
MAAIEKSVAPFDATMLAIFCALNSISLLISVFFHFANQSFCPTLKNSILAQNTKITKISLSTNGTLLLFQSEENDKLTH